MFLPYGTGALLVRDGAALRAAHEATAAYLPAIPHPDDFYDPSQHGPELSRGFPGLRVWLSVKLFGAAAFRDGDCRKAAAGARRVASGGRASARRHRRAAGAVAVRLSRHVAGRDRAEEDAATLSLLENTTRRGRVMLTGCTARGRFLGRVCVLSFRTHQQHIDHLVEDLAASLQDVLPAGPKGPALRRTTEAACPASADVL